MNSSEVMVKCRVCGNQAKAGSFVLSPDHKIMVCPKCAGKKPEPRPQNPKPNTQNPLPKSQKPEDWDADDEELERLSRKKLPKQQLELGTKLKCRKCGFVFKFSGRRQCEYCNAEF